MLSLLAAMSLPVSSPVYTLTGDGVLFHHPDLGQFSRRGMNPVDAAAYAKNVVTGELPPMKLLGDEYATESEQEEEAVRSCVEALTSGKIDVAAAHQFLLFFDAIVDPVDCDALLGRAKLILGASDITEEEQQAMEAAEMAFAEDFGD